MSLSLLRKYVYLSNNQFDKFSFFLNQLIKFNKKFNLTSIIDPKEIIYKHFLDSIVYGKTSFIKKSNKILDFGSGGGFPGIPLAILFNKKSFLLVDSSIKKINFLKYVVNFLKLDNVEVIRERGEILAHNNNFRESFDIVLSRAVANLSTLSEYVLPFVKLNGYAVLTKELSAKEEVEKSKLSIKTLGGDITEIKNYILPEYNNKRMIIFIRKNNKSPNKYPRKLGIPLKRPI